MINAGSFYNEYHGHKIAHLRTLHRGLSDLNPDAPIVFLMGDSSLDNKHWFFDEHRSKASQMHDSDFTDEAVNGYEDILNPKRMVQDVAYWLNKTAADQLGPNQIFTINASVEESTVGDRNLGLLPQDQFVKDHVSEKDFIIVSLGGNDIALKPTPRTIINMIALLLCPEALIKGGWAPGLGYFKNLFSKRIQKILENVTSETKPKKILICMIYYLDEAKVKSWANFTLEKMGYDKNPKKLQLIIRKVYELVKFDMKDTLVEKFPLFEVLDGKDTNDYLQRVEPSVKGGKKMGEALFKAICPEVS